MNALPAKARGHVTFGSLNRLLKVNEKVIDAWGAILAAVPRSQLMILTEGCEDGAWWLKCMRKRGIAPDRIRPVTRCTPKQYLQLAQQIDIALDTFPYNGQTTTYDMLWMGVPIITLAGRTPASRMGLGMLANLGLTELAVSSSEQYVEVASQLGKNFDRLGELRRTLRERMASSVLMDAAGFTRRMEAAFRNLWDAQ